MGVSMLLAIVSAVIPIFFWYTIIIRKDRKGLQFFFFLVFIISGIFALCIFFFKEDILLFFTKISGVFFGFVLLGMVIEYGKNFIIRLFAKNFFKSIDDVVDLAFATALGFTFFENILVFYSLFQGSFSYGTPVEILKNIVVQEFFILPIHLVSSGIFGYYYGLSLFARDGLKRQKFFRTRTIIKGTLISTVFYGLFFFLKEQEYKVSDLALFVGINNLPVYLDEKILPLIAFGFFSAGSLFLFYKLEKKHFLTTPLVKR